MIYKNCEDKPLISFVVLNSRGDCHPIWVGQCCDSIMRQNVPIELVLVDNIGRKKTIGEGFNEGVKEATSDYVAFVGDDDSISFDLAEILWRWINDVNMRGSNV